MAKINWNRVPTTDEILKKPKPKKPRSGCKNRLYDILQEREMSQSELSDITGLYQGHISEIVRGIRKGVNISVALRIARALQCRVEDIFFE